MLEVVLQKNLSWGGTPPPFFMPAQKNSQTNKKNQQRRHLQETSTRLETDADHYRVQKMQFSTFFKVWLNFVNLFS